MRVNIDGQALTEPRIRRVARRLNVSHFEVLGRLVHLWHVCYERREEFIDCVDADIATGELPGFVDALVTEQLADRVDDSSIRLRGVSERISWLERQAEKGVRSGEARRQRSAELQNRTHAQQGLDFGSTGGSTEPRTYSLAPDLALALAPDLSGIESPMSPGPSSAQNGSGGINGAPHPSKDAYSATGERVEQGKRPPEQALNLASMLIARISQNNPEGRLARCPEGRKKHTRQNWAAVIDRMHRLDNLSWEEIGAMITWCQNDPFWRSNVLGADALRSHWDQLVAQRRRVGAVTPNQARPGPTELARREVDELERRAAKAVP